MRTRIDYIDTYGDRMEQARTSTRGLERVVRKRSALPRREDAEAFEASQPASWRARIVRRTCTVLWWAWWLRPEAGR